MIQSPQDNRPPISPQLAFRVAIIGGIALAAFAIVFFRLWYLQVLSGEEYLAEARQNRVRHVTIQAPRGNIVDRNGTTLVENRVSTAVQVDTTKVPKDPRERVRLYARLSRVLGISRRPRRCRVGEKVVERSPIACTIAQEQWKLPYAKVTVKQDVSQVERAYLDERKNDFPGVTVDRVFLREYPHRDLAAHLFGTVGQISEEELRQQHFRGVEQGTIVGKGGVEYAYDRYLRGKNGAARIQINALGQPRGELTTREPRQGRQLKLSIDFDLQRAGQDALQKAIGLAAGNGARAGAFVALDPRNGEVLAMGSAPEFDPNDFARPLSQETFDRKFGEAAGSPLVNRAISAQYPTGSTFKLATAVAALEEGVIDATTPVNDPGKIKISNITFKNAGSTAYGMVDMRRAIQVSSDVYFYRLGAAMNGMKGQVLQRWAKALGIGRRTRIDIPGEFRGLIPDRKWRNEGFEKYTKCKKKYPEDDGAKCGFMYRPWSIGDNVNLSVGQGDLQATPLQLAVAYATVANGGRRVRPHLGLEIENAAGNPIQEIEPPPTKRVRISAATRDAVLDGLRLAASADGGTSSDVFRGWPHGKYPVYGKTGTAERPPQPDQSWYVAYVPHRTRPIVVALTVERGGFGAAAAAPAVRLILSEWFGVKKRLVVGESATR